MTDNVNKPAHYRQGEIECIDAIRAALTPEEFRGYCKGNVLKYVWRERHKGGDTFLVIHPLWRVDGSFGEKFAGGSSVKFIDTFNLERRPLRAIEMAQAVSAIKSGG